MIREQIQEMIKDCMKNKETDKLPFLRVVASEMDLVKSKDPKKFDEVKVIEGMRKNAVACGNEEEVKFYDDLLPKKMNDGEIYEALAAIAEEGMNIGDFMKAWNSDPKLKGKADMGLVSKLIRETYLS